MITENIYVFYQNLKQNKTILAIDYGTKKSGFAISTLNWKLSTPFSNFKIRKDETELLNEISNIITSQNVGAFVIGLPIGLNNESTDQTKLTMTFIKKVNDLYNLPIFVQNETYTSLSAREFLQNMSLKKSKFQYEMIDSIAANIMLEDVLHKINKIS